MVEHDALSATREAYDAAAPTYAQLFRDTLRDRPLDRAILGAFAEVASASGDGQVADLGCGPGHITAYLDELGLAAFGVDASPAMIKLARQAYPGLRFDVGSMAALNIADGVLGGALSRWSIIHTPPQELPSSWRSSAVCWHLAATFWSAFRQAMIRLTRRRSSITQSRWPIGGRLITSPRCCASPGWPR
jgi:SAM-dependent methyltransferase